MTAERAPRRNKYSGRCKVCGCYLAADEGYYVGQSEVDYYDRYGDKRARFASILWCDFCLATHYHAQEMRQAATA